MENLLHHVFHEDPRVRTLLCFRACLSSLSSLGKADEQCSLLLCDSIEQPHVAQRCATRTESVLGRQPYARFIDKTVQQHVQQQEKKRDDPSCTPSRAVMEWVACGTDGPAADASALGQQLQQGARLSGAAEMSAYSADLERTAKITRNEKAFE